MHRLQQARELEFEGDVKKAKGHGAIDFDRLQRCVEEVEEVAVRLSPSHCFAHNDLLSGNILVPDEVHLDPYLPARYRPTAASPLLGFDHFSLAPTTSP